MLREFGSEFGFAVECIDPVVCRGEVVSSSAIRRAVCEGRIDGRAAFFGPAIFAGWRNSERDWVGSAGGCAYA